MKVHNLHAWNVSPKQATEIQKGLASKIRLTGSRTPPAIVAGADISFTKHSSRAFAGIVLLEFPSLKVVNELALEDELTFPYVPGLLSFREAPILLKLFCEVTPAPDLLFFDGQGLAHPRKFGLACHLGLILDRPAIGCAKTKLTGEYKEPGLAKGSCSDLLDNDQNVGAVLRSRENCNPIFVSVGHKIDINTAIQRTLECTTRYRIPEPTRLAHHLVNRVRKKSTE
ncbi:MAG: endonuclease V [Nitrospinaceae bacterium]|nr:MAG: endonuclease V [Nitrospinaceae bacterium]